MSGGEWFYPEGAVDPLWLPDGCRFDPAVPDLFRVFCEQMLVWPTGFKAGEPVRWERWQIDRLINPMFGVLDENGLRVCETVFLLAARGIGKTTLAAAVGLFGLTFLGVAAPEVDIFAVSREQADRVFECAVHFVHNSDELSTKLAVFQYKRKIEYAAVSGVMVVRSGDAEAELGHNPSMVLFDELLAQKNRQLWDTVTTSMGKRPEGLLMVLTTPSVKVETFARLEYDNAKRILEERSLDRSYLPVIFESDPDDDPWDEATWHKACPALKSGFLNINVVRKEAQKAKRDPTARQAFEVFRLARWAQSGAGFVNMTMWDESAGPLPDVEKLKKLPCYFGLDMSGTTDLSSLAIMWWDEETDDAYVLWRHWTTEQQFARLDEWTSGAFSKWSDDPSVVLNVHPGNWIDAGQVADQVADDYDVFTPWEIGLDMHRSREMNRLLGEEGSGLPVKLLSQTGKMMQAATERIQALVEAGKLRHNGDKISRWAAANCEVKYDPFNFPKLVKTHLQHKLARIDPIDALNMACDRRLAWEREGGEPEIEPQVWRI